jgi:DNA mismatch repair ATPase MutS
MVGLLKMVRLFSILELSTKSPKDITMKKLKIRIKKKIQNLSEEFTDSQLDNLNNFHRELDMIRKKIQDLKKLRKALEKDIVKKKKILEPIEQADLFDYCSRIQRVSKGKFGEKK